MENTNPYAIYLLPQWELTISRELFGMNSSHQANSADGKAFRFFRQRQKTIGSFNFFFAARGLDSLSRRKHASNFGQVYPAQTVLGSPSI
jgi:hypothetical protein